MEDNGFMEMSAQPAQISVHIPDLRNAHCAGVVQVPKEHALGLYKDYCAAGGLQTDEAGSLRRVSVEEFSQSIGWGRRTLYDWRSADPDFWDDVAARRSRIYGALVPQVWRAVYERALKGEAKQAEMVLSHYSDYSPASHKQDATETRGFADFLQLVRKRRNDFGSVDE